MSYFVFSADPVMDADRCAADEDERVARYPKCAHCHYEIQDERLAVINGDLFHLDCIDEAFGEWTENHIEE